MELTPELIRLFAPTPIYTAVKVFAVWVLQFVTPILLFIAIWIRITETQLESFSGQSRWAAALKDFFWWGFILGGYFLFGGLVADLFNAFYGMFDGKGSLSVIFQQMESFINKMNAMEKTDDGFSGAALNLLTAPFTFLSFGIYYLSLLFVTFIIMFMRIAVALGFGVVFIWGLIAIPMAMTSNFRLLRGWGLLAAGVAVWPIVESIFMGLFSPVLIQAASGLFSGAGSTFNLEKTGVYFIYTLLNIFVAVIVIAAPIVTASIVANSQALTGMVAPFVAGAFAATGAAMQGSKNRIVSAADSSRQGIGRALGSAAQALHSKISPFSGGSGGGMGPATYRASSDVSNSSKGYSFSQPSQGGLGPADATASMVPSQASTANQANGSQGRKEPSGTKPRGKGAVAAAAFTAASQTPTSAEGSESPSEPARRRDPEKARRGVFINESLKRRKGGG